MNTFATPCIRSLFLAVGLSLLGGCATTLPQETLQSSVLSAEETARNFNLDVQWWHRYDNASLNAAVEMALERNVDLAKAAVLVNRARFEANLIGADLLPVFSGSGSASSEKNLSNGKSTRHFGSDLDLSYEIDLWKRLRNAANAADWELRATEDDLRATRLALINTVIDTWFQLRYLERSIAVTSGYVDRYARLAALLNTKYTLGKVASVEPLQAEQALLSARNKLLSLQTEQRTTQATMRDLLALAPEEALPEAHGNILDMPSVPVDLDVPVAALAARPDISSAENRLRSAFCSLAAEKASWFPRISVGSSLGLSSKNASTFFDAPFLGGLVNLSFPFLDWNSLRWNIKISETAFESARLDFMQTVTSALNEVDAAYTSWANTGRTLNNVRMRYEKDLRISRYYQTRYELGAAELKDYLEALNNADSDELLLLEIRFKVLSLENAIYKAMGGRYTGKSGQ